MKRFLFPGLLLIVLAPLIFWLSAVLPNGKLPKACYEKVSHQKILGDNNRILAQFENPNYVAGPWLKTKQIPPLIKASAIAAEDKRFYLHLGLDWMACLRALGQNILAGKIVSGGSTITMQLARLLNPGPRNLKSKLSEVRYALWLEARLEKEQILSQYLNRAPFGGPIVGLNAASRELFGKHPQNLAPQEAALLMALPKNPAKFLKPKYKKELKARRDHILKKMAQTKAIDHKALQRALGSKVEFLNLEQKYITPHFARYLRNRLKKSGLTSISTYINPTLQSKIINFVKKTCQKHKSKGVRKAAVLVLNNQDLSVMAWVGSPDFYDPNAGQVDGVLAKRQPGSALKPFLYALALEKGYTLADMVKDEPLGLNVSGGVYRPVDYDGHYRGQVRLRVALASSLNLPALRLTNDLGVRDFLQKLRQAGLYLPKSAGHYGLGLALGNGEVSLLELTQAYACLANNGFWSPIRLWKGQKQKQGKRIFKATASRLIADALSDDSARALGFGRHGYLELPFQAAVKTGTSQKYKDNWCLGFTSQYTVGVWVGNSQAQAMDGVSGVTGAAPLWREIMLYLHKDTPGKLACWPLGIERAQIDPTTGKLPTPNTLGTIEEFFAPGTLSHVAKNNSEKIKIEKSGLELIAPFEKAVYALDPDLPTKLQVLLCKAQIEKQIQGSSWQLNGQKLKSDPKSLKTRLPLKPGNHVLQLTVWGNWGKEEQKVHFEVVP